MKVFTVSDLFVSLFPAPQTGPVVVPETQKVVIGNQPFNGVPDHVNVDGLPLQAKPEKYGSDWVEVLHRTSFHY